MKSATLQYKLEVVVLSLVNDANYWNITWPPVFLGNDQGQTEPELCFDLAAGAMMAIESLKGDGAQCLWLLCCLGRLAGGRALHHGCQWFRLFIKPLWSGSSFKFDSSQYVHSSYLRSLERDNFIQSYWELEHVIKNMNIWEIKLLVTFFFNSTYTVLTEHNSTKLTNKVKTFEIFRIYYQMLKKTQYFNELVIQLLLISVSVCLSSPQEDIACVHNQTSLHLSGLSAVFTSM